MNYSELKDVIRALACTPSGSNWRVIDAARQSHMPWTAMSGLRKGMASAAAVVALLGSYGCRDVNSSAGSLTRVGAVHGPVSAVADADGITHFSADLTVLATVRDEGRSGAPVPERRIQYSVVAERTAAGTWTVDLVLDPTYSAVSRPRDPQVRLPVRMRMPPDGSMPTLQYSTGESGTLDPESMAAALASRTANAAASGPRSSGRPTARTSVSVSDGWLDAFLAIGVSAERRSARLAHLFGAATGRFNALDRYARTVGIMEMEELVDPSNNLTVEESLRRDGQLQVRTRHTYHAIPGRGLYRSKSISELYGRVPGRLVVVEQSLSNVRVN